MSEDLYNQIEKSYDPKDIEDKWYQYWLDNKYYIVSSKVTDKKTFSIVIPPPNVTGSLHIGHALNNTLQDIIIRYKRMKGQDALWIPGTDHAGIATQMIVEKEIAKEGISREQLGREEFINRVWEFKKESGNSIINQLKRLGALPDWSKERFTLDLGLSEAVNKVFVDLYKEGLIYRDNRLVNWDPKLKTAISDLEVESREVAGKLWYIKYPLDKNDSYITVATTRPETMLGDVAVAVHPDDPRYKDHVGCYVQLPLTDRIIPIITDEYSDPDKGSGAVKITPAHDFNDFEVGKRHGLEMMDIFDENAKLNNTVPDKYIGMDRFEARKAILNDLNELGLLDKEQNIQHTVPYGDRTGEIIEPRLTTQWYVNACELAKEAIRVVKNRSITFHPKFWENTYFEWMRNIEPWCISRQIWWGHQIPVWYGPDGHEFVETSEDLAQESATKHYGHHVDLKRDEDVLDTWFSSGLWPFSTMGWPEITDCFKRYYPTTVLITGFDIIFFWVARMIMMGLKFTRDVPFRHVYIHGLIRDEKGEKMSKTRGNVIDPLDIIDEYGADSLRFSLAAMASQGRDIKLSLSVIKGYRNFINKIWNASRFLILNLNGYNPDYRYSPSDLTIFDKWILTKLNRLITDINEDFDNYEYDKAANKIYQFIWADFCDWYIEVSKPFLNDKDQKERTQNLLVRILTSSLQLLHPFTPFVTEEIYYMLRSFGVTIVTENGEISDSIIISEFPKYNENEIFKDECEKVELIKDLIVSIRNLRAEYGVKPNTEVRVLLAANRKDYELIQFYFHYIKRLAYVDSVEFVKGKKPDKCLTQVIRDMEVFIPVDGVIDLQKEIARMEKELEKIQKDLNITERKLKNSDFIDKAPEDIVKKEKLKYEEYNINRIKIQEALNRLSTIK